MVKKFKELVLTEDTTFTESIEVETSITCKNNMRYSLNVSGDINARNIIAGDIIAGDIIAGDIDARNIIAGDIIAGDIIAGDIDARNIIAMNIIAGDIIAGDILCEKRIKKLKTCKTISRVFIQNKSSLVRKEQMGF